MSEHRASPLSAGLCNASMLLYILWLLLPCLQRLGHALTGCLALGLFAAGVLLDGDTLPKRWRTFVPCVLCALLVPFVLWRFLDRGASFLGFYAQQVMFWFPLLWVAYARERGDERLYRHVGRALLIAMALTTLTTTGWLIEGILRGGGEKVYAYSRSLGFGEPGNEAFLRELMLRNIGGYDFVYASVLSLPLTCYAVGMYRGWKRAAFGAFLALQLVMIVLSQYTYAILFAALGAFGGRVAAVDAPLLPDALARARAAAGARRRADGAGRIRERRVQPHPAPERAHRRDGRFRLAARLLSAAAGGIRRLAAGRLDLHRREEAQSA